MRGDGSGAAGGCRSISLALAGLLLSLSRATGAEPDKPPPSLTDRVTLARSAATMRDAAALLAQDLRIQLVVAEPPEAQVEEPGRKPEADAGRAPGDAGRAKGEARRQPAPEKNSAPPSGAAATRAPAADAIGKARPAPRVSLRFDRRPLKEVLDGAAGAFGYGWEDADGIYVFRPRPAPEAAGRAIVDEVRARLQPPSREERLGVVAGLDGMSAGPDGVPVSALSQGDREVINRLVLGTLLDRLESTLNRVQATRERLTSAPPDPLPFDAFIAAAQMQLTVSADGYHLAVRGPKAGQPGEQITRVVSVSRPTPAKAPVAPAGGARRPAGMRS